MGETYSLYWGDVELAHVVHESDEHPTRYGRWERLAKDDFPHLRDRLDAYLEEAVRSNARLMQDDASPEEEHEVADRERPFADIIISDQWRLVRADGRVLWILCPSFLPGGRIGWRDDFTIRGWGPRKLG